MSKTKFNGDIKKLIDEAIKSNISSLKKEGLLKDKVLSPYQKTERILYDYNDYKKAILDHEEEIEDIKKYGLKQRSMSIIPMPTGGSSNQTQEEREHAAIKSLEDRIDFTKRVITLLDYALAKIKDEPYFAIITMYYFENKTNGEIGDYLKVDESTIRRNKSKLVRKLSIYLFSDEVMNELYS